MTKKTLIAIYAAVLLMAVAASYTSSPAPVLVAEDPVPQCPTYPDCGNSN